MTAATKARLAARLPPLEATIGEAGQEHHAGQPARMRPSRAGPRREVPSPRMKQAMARQVKPIPPAAKCSRPCQEIAAGCSGAPTGKPSAGSARKMPAAIRLAPYTPISRGAQRAPRPGSSARRSPDREGDHHQAGDHEVRDLDPARSSRWPAGSTGAGRDRNPSRVDGLRERHHDVDRPGDDAVAEQGLGHPVGGFAVAVRQCPVCIPGRRLLEVRCSVIGLLLDEGRGPGALPALHHLYE